MIHKLPNEDRTNLLHLLNKLRDQYNMYIDEDKEVIDQIHSLYEEVYYNVFDEED